MNVEFIFRVFIYNDIVMFIVKFIVSFNFFLTPVSHCSGSATALHKQTNVVKNDYRIRLNASIDVSRHLLHQGLPFRGHDESEESTNKGNF